MNDFLSELITAEHEAQYKAFVDKFKPKKTTDDCYTPLNVYNAVADYVAETFNLNRDNFKRPFYPGGDYIKDAATYDKNAVVVDNPPFSILGEIQNFYIEHNIKFWLFAPHLTFFNDKDSVCFYPVKTDILYENGAVVPTSYLTNLQNEYRVICDPVLYDKVKKANDENVKKDKKNLPNYIYNDFILTSSKCEKLAKNGIPFKVKKSECFFIRELTEQKRYGKSLFGNAFLLSTAQAQAQAQAQEKQGNAKEWQLLTKELLIIKELDKNAADGGGDV